MEHNCLDAESSLSEIIAELRENHLRNKKKVQRVCDSYLELIDVLTKNIDKYNQKMFEERLFILLSSYIFLLLDVEEPVKVLESLLKSFPVIKTRDIKFGPLLRLVRFFDKNYAYKVFENIIGNEIKKTSINEATDVYHLSHFKLSLLSKKELSTTLISSSSLKNLPILLYHLLINMSSELDIREEELLDKLLDASLIHGDSIFFLLRKFLNDNITKGLKLKILSVLRFLYLNNFYSGITADFSLKVASIFPNESNLCVLYLLFLMLSQDFISHSVDLPVLLKEFVSKIKQREYLNVLRGICFYFVSYASVIDFGSSYSILSFTNQYFPKNFSSFDRYLYTKLREGSKTKLCLDNSEFLLSMVENIKDFNCVEILICLLKYTLNTAYCRINVQNDKIFDQFLHRVAAHFSDLGTNQLELVNNRIPLLLIANCLKFRHCKKTAHALHQLFSKKMIEEILRNIFYILFHRFTCVSKNSTDVIEQYCQCFLFFLTIVDKSSHNLLTYMEELYNSVCDQIVSNLNLYNFQYEILLLLYSLHEIMQKPLRNLRQIFDVDINKYTKRCHTVLLKFFFSVNKSGFKHSNNYIKAALKSHDSSIITAALNYIVERNVDCNELGFSSVLFWNIMNSFNERDKANFSKLVDSNYQYFLDHIQFDLDYSNKEKTPIFLMNIPIKKFFKSMMSVPSELHFHILPLIRLGLDSIKEFYLKIPYECLDSLTAIFTLSFHMAESSSIRDYLLKDKLGILDECIDFFIDEFIKNDVAVFMFALLNVLNKPEPFILEESEQHNSYIQNYIDKFFLKGLKYENFSDKVSNIFYRDQCVTKKIDLFHIVVRNIPLIVNFDFFKLFMLSSVQVENVRSLEVFKNVLNIMINSKHRTEMFRWILDNGNLYSKELQHFMLLLMKKYKFTFSTDNFDDFNTVFKTGCYIALNSDHVHGNFNQKFKDHIYKIKEFDNNDFLNFAEQCKSNYAEENDSVKDFFDIDYNTFVDELNHFIYSLEHGEELHGEQLISLEKKMLFDHTNRYALSFIEKICKITIEQINNIDTYTFEIFSSMFFCDTNIEKFSNVLFNFAVAYFEFLLKKDTESKIFIYNNNFIKLLTFLVNFLLSKKDFRIITILYFVCEFYDIESFFSDTNIFSIHPRFLNRVSEIIICELSSIHNPKILDIVYFFLNFPGVLEESIINLIYKKLSLFLTIESNFSIYILRIISLCTPHPSLIPLTNTISYLVNHFSKQNCNYLGKLVVPFERFVDSNIISSGEVANLFNSLILSYNYNKANIHYYNFIKLIIDKYFEKINKVNTVISTIMYIIVFELSTAEFSSFLRLYPDIISVLPFSYTFYSVEFFYKSRFDEIYKQYFHLATILLHAKVDSEEVNYYTQFFCSNYNHFQSIKYNLISEIPGFKDFIALTRKYNMTEFYYSILKNDYFVIDLYDWTIDVDIALECFDLLQANLLGLSFKYITNLCHQVKKKILNSGNLDYNMDIIKFIRNFLLKVPKQSISWVQEILTQLNDKKLMALIILQFFFCEYSLPNFIKTLLTNNSGILSNISMLTDKFLSDLDPEYYLRYFQFIFQNITTENQISIFTNSLSNIKKILLSEETMKYLIEELLLLHSKHNIKLPYLPFLSDRTRILYNIIYLNEEESCNKCEIFADIINLLPDSIHERFHYLSNMNVLLWTSKYLTTTVLCLDNDFFGSYTLALLSSYIQNISSVLAYNIFKRNFSCLKVELITGFLEKLFSESETYPSLKNLIYVILSILQEYNVFRHDFVRYSINTDYFDLIHKYSDHYIINHDSKCSYLHFDLVFSAIYCNVNIPREESAGIYQLLISNNKSAYNILYNSKDISSGIVKQFLDLSCFYEDNIKCIQNSIKTMTEVDHHFIINLEDLFDVFISKKSYLEDYILHKALLGCNFNSDRTTINSSYLNIIDSMFNETYKHFTDFSNVSSPVLVPMVVKDILHFNDNEYISGYTTIGDIIIDKSIVKQTIHELTVVSGVYRPVASLYFHIFLTSKSPKNFYLEKSVEVYTSCINWLSSYPQYIQFEILSRFLTVIILKKVTSFSLRYYNSTFNNYSFLLFDLNNAYIEELFLSIYPYFKESPHFIITTLSKLCGISDINNDFNKNYHVFLSYLLKEYNFRPYNDHDKLIRVLLNFVRLSYTLLHSKSNIIESVITETNTFLPLTIEANRGSKKNFLDKNISINPISNKFNFKYDSFCFNSVNKKGLIINSFDLETTFIKPSSIDIIAKALHLCFKYNYSTLVRGICFNCLNPSIEIHNSSYIMLDDDYFFYDENNLEVVSTNLYQTSKDVNDLILKRNRLIASYASCVAFNHLLPSNNLTPFLFNEKGFCLFKPAYNHANNTINYNNIRLYKNYEHLLGPNAFPTFCVHLGSIVGSIKKNIELIRSVLELVSIKSCSSVEDTECLRHHILNERKRTNTLLEPIVPSNSLDDYLPTVQMFDDIFKCFFPS